MPITIARVAKPNAAREEEEAEPVYAGGVIALVPAGGVVPSTGVLAPPAGEVESAGTGTAPVPVGMVEAMQAGPGHLTVVVVG